MTRIAIILALVVAAGGCKKKPRGTTIEQTMAKMDEFATAMCKCTNKPCSDVVQEAMTRWSVDEAAKAQDRETPSPEAMKKMTEIGQKYAECMTKAMGPTDPAPAFPGPLPPPMPPDPPPGPPIKVSTPADRPSIGTLIAEARGHAHADQEDLAIHILRARYVAADGTLDPKYGELTISFGNRMPLPPGVVDDPDRPTGAPIPDPVVPPPPKRDDNAECPNAVWGSTTGWRWGKRSCMAMSELKPRCTTPEVWKRAMQIKGVPTRAVAILELVRNQDASQSWEFSIRDELRKVDVTTRIPDTCEPVAEQP